MWVSSWSGIRSGVEEPPGMIALIVRPSGAPPPWPSISSRNVPADVARLAGLLQRRAQHLELGAVLAADVDERRRRPDAVAHRDHPLDQRVRVSQHDLAVLERARLGLVGVDAQVGGLAILGQE